MAGPRATYTADSSMPWGPQHVPRGSLTLGDSSAPSFWRNALTIETLPLGVRPRRGIERAASGERIGWQ